MEWVNANSSARWGSPDPFLPNGRGGAGGANTGTGAGGPPLGSAPNTGDLLSRPTSPDGLGGGLYSSYTMGTGLEGLICASPPPTRTGRENPPR